VEFFPKFHCETNPIERVWSVAKKKARELCDFSFVNLRNRVPLILEEVPISSIRAFFRRAWRYISAYSLGLDGMVADSAVKKCKSHRKISENVDNLVDMYNQEKK